MRIASILFAVAVGFLAGCSDEPAPKGREALNTQELQVIDAYRDRAKDNRRWPANVVETMYTAAETRKHIPAKGFFCAERDTLVAMNYKINSWNKSNSSSMMPTLSDVYRSVYGQSVEQSCGVDEVVQPKVVTPKGFKQEQPVVRGNKLTTEMYDKMIESANYCARSKSYMMDATKNKGVLTTDDYDGLMDTVLECKRFELEQTLQQK